MKANDRNVMYYLSHIKILSAWTCEKGSVTNVRACEPEPRAASREPIFASYCVFFSVFPFFVFF